MAWKKQSSKRYQIELDGEWVSLSVPYGKVEKIVEVFFDKGGVVDMNTGTVLTDIPTLVRSFRELGDVLLSEFDNTGELKEVRYCRELSIEEVPELFEIAVDVIQNFTEAVLGLQKNLTDKAAVKDDSETKGKTA